MKRIDLQPTKDNLLRLIKSDSIGRNAELVEMLNLLCSIEGPFTIFLDSGWGSGKTFFVKQLELILKNLNSQLGASDDIGTIREMLSKQDSPAQEASFLPIYYNAWENDYWSDPLPSIAQQLVGGSLSDVEFKTQIKDQQILIDGLEAVLKAFGLGGVRDLAKSLSGEDLLNDYRLRNELREQVAGLIDSILECRANKLLLIVDELDRCKPTFAVRVLEEIKSLFDNDKVIVIAAVNTAELARTVEGIYGTGFDGSRYLSRFYDIKALLRAPDANAYLQTNGIRPSMNVDRSIVIEMINSLGMSMRDINRYTAMLRDVEMKSVNWPIASGGGSASISCARYCILQVLLAIQIVDQQSYQEIRNDRNGELLLKWIKRSSEALAFFDRAWVESIPDDSKPGGTLSTDDVRLRVAGAYLELFWNVDSTSTSYMNAHEYLLGKAFGHPDLRFIARDILK